MPSEPGRPDVVVVRGGPERIDDLQPLWESLSEHHAAIAPHLRQLGGLRTAAESWRLRRKLYEEWLAEPGAFVLVADDGGRPVGYALVHMRGPEETWTTGERIAELESLTVLPEYRGRGIGSALLDRAVPRAACRRGRSLGRRGDLHERRRGALLRAGGAPALDVLVRRARPGERRAQINQTTIRMISAIPTPVAVIVSGARFWRQKSGSARAGGVAALGRLAGPVVVVPAAHRNLGTRCPGRNSR